MTAAGGLREIWQRRRIRKSVCEEGQGGAVAGRLPWKAWLVV